MNTPTKTYCQHALNHPYHGPYHDNAYGLPISDESALFERLVLEINQAGLSWLTVLKKQMAFRLAYSEFNVEIIANYQEKDRLRLLADAGIIRNKLKVNAAIVNAKQVLAFRTSHGGFYSWLLAHHPLQKTEWVKLFKKTFVFTGGEITGEFLMSIGMLPGAHEPSCPVYQRLAAMKSPPLWMQVVNSNPNFYNQ